MVSFEKYNFILASNSPRRKELLEKLGLKLNIQINEVDEIYSENLKPKEIVEFLARLKSEKFIALKENEILITSDTIVSLKDKILGKPKNIEESKNMLNVISGSINTVFTGVCIKTNKKSIVFSEKTNVYFKNLSKDEIDFYIENYKPFDKAGSYGIQDWIGLIGVKKIVGCYYNVMGFPLALFYKKLNDFLK